MNDQNITLSGQCLNTHWTSRSFLVQPQESFLISKFYVTPLAKTEGDSSDFSFLCISFCETRTSSFRKSMQPPASISLSHQSNQAPCSEMPLRAHSLDVPFWRKSVRNHIPTRLLCTIWRQLSSERWSVPTSLSNRVSLPKRVHWHNNLSGTATSAPPSLSALQRGQSLLNPARSHTWARSTFSAVSCSAHSQTNSSRSILSHFPRLP